MTYIALLLILTGLYLVDSGVKNRAPIGFLQALLSSDKPDLRKTLTEFNGKWSKPLGETAITPLGGSEHGGSKGPGIGLTPTSDPRNGRLSSSELMPLSFAPAHRLAPAAAAAMVKMNAAYRDRFGTSIFITDSYRTYEQQVILKALKGNLAATPGTSNHGLGLAVDLGGGINSFGTPQHVWMQENASRYGWVHPSWAQQGGSKPEAWHWEYVGSSEGKS